MSIVIKSSANYERGDLWPKRCLCICLDCPLFSSFSVVLSLEIHLEIWRSSLKISLWQKSPWADDDDGGILSKAQIAHFLWIDSREVFIGNNGPQTARGVYAVPCQKWRKWEHKREVLIQFGGKVCALSCPHCQTWESLTMNKRETLLEHIENTEKGDWRRLAPAAASLQNWDL